MANTGPQPQHKPEQLDPEKKKINVPLWTFISLALAVAIIIALSSFDDLKGNPLFDSGVLQSAISGSLLLGAAVGPSFLQNRRDTQTIKHEVKNDHKKNFRVETDDRFRMSYNQNMTIIDQNKQILDRLGRHDRKIDALDKKFDGKVDELRKEISSDRLADSDRFTSLERGLLGFLRGDPMTPRGHHDGL